MAEFAVLLQAIAAILWPTFAFTLLFVYRPQIADLVRRLKRGKLLGQEIELQESLVLLDKSAVSVAKEVGALPAPIHAQPDEGRLAHEATIHSIITEAGRSPKAALILLANELEKLARDMIATSGHLAGRSFIPIHDAISELDRMFGLPRHVPGSLKFFWDARTLLVHGKDASDDDILRAIDSGLTILKALQAMPREINHVHDPAATLYHDEALSVAMEGVKGIVLETTAPGGATKSFRVFPSTRTHFKKGSQVAWEWNMDRVTGPAWYRDPATGLSKVAWLSAAEFIGRNLEEL